jgi:hypothetical protein
MRIASSLLSWPRTTRDLQTQNVWADSGFQLLESQGTWQVRSDAQESVHWLAAELAAEQVPQDWQVIKRSEDRYVLRVPIAGSDEVWAVKGLRIRSRSAWFAKAARNSDEGSNQLIARKRGIRTPKLVAQGEIRNAQGEQWLILCSEWACMPCMRDSFLARPSEATVEELLHRATYSLRMLFDAGCNHVDFGPHAILKSEQGPAEDLIIDFEQATFKDALCVNTLAAQLGYFGWSIATNRDWATQEQVRRWSEQVFAQWGLPLSASCRQSFENNLQARQSLRARRAR